MIAAGFLIIVGIIGLLVAANYFVLGAVSLAHHFKIPDVIIGATIIAVGTSAPELFININASLIGAGDIVISNIVGSNIVNVCLGLGLACIICPIGFDKKSILLLVPYGLIPLFLIIISVVYSPGNPTLSRVYGIILLMGFILSFFIKSESEDFIPQQTPASTSKLLIAIAQTLSGLFLLPYFGNLVVNNSIALATLCNVPKSVIGATIVAAGGSLPEVASCISAARIKRPRIALGNIVGSQIFNGFGILGLSIIFSPVQFTSLLVCDVIFLLSISLLLILFLRKAGKSLSLGSGIVFILLYGSYAVYLTAVALS